MGRDYIRGRVNQVVGNGCEYHLRTKQGDLSGQILELVVDLGHTNRTGEDPVRLRLDTAAGELLVPLGQVFALRPA